jgi:hypothetical protein
MNFDYVISYEDRAVFHTSRWDLAGVNTKATGQLTRGRFWITCVDTADTVQVNVYKEPALTNLIASGTADISTIDTAPVQCTLAEENSSGLSGTFYFEDYDDDDSAGVEVLVSLIMDEDLSAEYGDISDLPAYDSTNGMAEFCAVATQNTLLKVSQVYKTEIGGYGAPEHLYKLSSDRLVPDYRAIANPDQLMEAAVHRALMVAFYRSHDMADDTMYSERAEKHETWWKEAIGNWNLAFISDPDSGDDTADSSGQLGLKTPIRL